MTSTSCQGHYQHFVALDLTTHTFRHLRAAGDSLRDGEVVALQRPGKQFYLDDAGTIQSLQLPGATRPADFPSFLWGYTKEGGKLEEFLDTSRKDIKDALHWLTTLLAAKQAPAPAPAPSTASICDLVSSETAVVEADISSSDASALLDNDEQDSPDISGLLRVLLVELYAGHEPMLFGLIGKHLERELVLTAAVTVDNGSNGTYQPGRSMPPGVIRQALLRDMAHPDTLEQVMQFVKEHLGAADVVVVAGGPPCTEYSVLRPCQDRRTPEEREADLQTADMLVARMLQACSLVRQLCEQRGKRFVMVMENAGSATENVLRDREVIKEFMSDPANRDVKYHQMHQCRYGINLPKKPTDVWTNIPHWEARRCLGSKHCFNCVFEKGHTRSVVKVQQKERAKWPEAFVQSVLDAMLKQAVG